GQPGIARCDAGTTNAPRLDREPGAGACRWRFGRFVEHLDPPGYSRDRAAAYAAGRSRSAIEFAGFVLHSRRSDRLRTAFWFGWRLASEARGSKRCVETGRARHHGKRTQESSPGTRSCRICARGDLARRGGIDDPEFLEPYTSGP